MAKWISVQGTGSGVGKSTVAAAICRILADRGHEVAPFKPVNYSLNAFPVNGTEIGYMSYFQARQAGSEISKHLNPVLVKPMEDKAEVITDEYSTCSYQELDRFVGRSYSKIKRSVEELDNSYEYVVMEGFSSLINSNLENNPNQDLVEDLEPEMVLVSDISSGGAEAAVAGTLELAGPEVRDMVEAVVVNKMGEKAPGRERLEEFMENETGKDIYLLPFSEQLNIPEEDSEPDFAGTGEIAVVSYPNASNTSDLYRLPRGKTVSADSPGDLENARLILLPGSKNVFSDLEWMRERGMAEKIRQKAGEATIFGVCGGFQMLGSTIQGNSIEQGEAPGLDLIEMKTSYGGSKKLERVEAQFGEKNFDGYRIHYGRTAITRQQPLFEISGEPEGHFDGGVGGTYIHDSLSHRHFLEWLLEEAGLDPGETEDAGWTSIKDNLEPLANDLL